MGWHTTALGNACGPAIHLTQDAICDKVLPLGHNELDLSWRFRMLGNVIGRPRHSMEAWLGPPNSIGAGAGYVLLHWQRPGFHMALKFDTQSLCLGITHQLLSDRFVDRVSDIVSDRVGGARPNDQRQGRE